MVFGPFGLKTGIHFAHYCLESGVVFEGTTGAYERIYREFQMNKKEIEICEFEMHLEKFFCLRSNLSNYDFCLKARSKNGYGF